MQDQREKDIQALCNAVMNVSIVNTGDYGMGGDCPFCYCGCRWDDEMNTITNHKPDCAYLIAKDLSTKSK